MDPSKLFRSLKLDSIKNYILYLSGICLILSLAGEIFGVSNLQIQKASFTFVIYGLYLWLLEYIVVATSDFVKNYDNWQLALLWLAYSLVGFFVAFNIALDLSLLDFIF